VVARPAALDFFLREAGNAIKRELRMPKAAGRAYFESLASVLAIHVAGNYADPGRPVPVHCGLPPHKLNRVLAFIDEHLAEAMPVKQLAGVVHMSPYHFARMFRRATGQSPHAYITLQRMEHAKRLLSDTNLPLVEVAGRAGFQTQAHFTGVFHRHAGVTPRIFRIMTRASFQAGNTPAAFAHCRLQGPISRNGDRKCHGNPVPAQGPASSTPQRC
jgi:AraC family transcriptional regulator